MKRVSKIMKCESNFIECESKFMKCELKISKRELKWQSIKCELKTNNFIMFEIFIKKKYL